MSSLRGFPKGHVSRWLNYSRDTGEELPDDLGELLDAWTLSQAYGILPSETDTLTQWDILAAQVGRTAESMNNGGK